MLRHFLGFDPEMFESVNTNYPRYNVVRTDEESVSVEVAVPGFTKEEVKVEQDGNKLQIKAKAIDWLQEGESYLHKGFSSKGFDRQFILGEFMEVDSVRLKDGILTINIEKNIPDEKKPKTFDIQ
jgi:molecular chaperone IbpA|tara:strand:- start:194 stop:568 length:375 start_codon:yes stop_codon:yes gene_type:complete